MPLPVGKLPVDLLEQLLARSPVLDPRVLLGPGIGLDCAVLDFGATLLVLKSDPITFASDEIGWYAVQVNANDIATSGADPRWFLATILLPEKTTTYQMVEAITGQVQRACQEIGVELVGGHTEITYGLERPILVGTMLGEVAADQLVTPRGAQPGDRILLTKGVPIEATAILAREFPEKLAETWSREEIARAARMLYDPGISVLPEARLAMQAGGVTAMHDPTEGGLSAALWELAHASGRTLMVDPEAVPIPRLSTAACQALGIDPLAAIASGALLLTAAPDRAEAIRLALAAAGILCAEIGWVEAGPAAVKRTTAKGAATWPRPERDAIAALFEDRV